MLIDIRLIVSNNINKIQLCIRLSNKNIINLPIHPMNGSTVANAAVNHLIKQGKVVLHDHYLRKEKVPFFSQKFFQQQSQQVVIHGGYQGQKPTNYSHFTMKNDQAPKYTPKDNSSCKSAQVTRQYKSYTKTPTTPKSSHLKYYSSKKKNRENPWSSINPYSDPSKQKQNHLIKLQDNKGSRIVIERAKLREESQQDIMRQHKRQMMMKEYQQKLSNEAFHKQRQDKQIEKQRMLQSHLKKGSNHSFNFDHDGELMLFQAPNQFTLHRPPQAAFKIDPEDIEQEQDSASGYNKKFERHKSFDFNKKEQQTQLKDYYQHQRIRSARGQAFASSVLRTVNLSKISMNGSLGQIDAQQFMKRNDLFNNNHTRQTTSIPFMQAKAGTVYTQITHNQVVQSIKPPSSTTANHGKEDREAEFKQLGGKDNALQGQRNRNQRKYSRTARIRVHQIQGQDLKGQPSNKVTKTAGEERGKGIITERRPQTSVNRGHITTNNQFLVQTLLQ